MKQAYLMLAHVWKPGKTSPAGWFVSEKLDGVRAYWDGGITRGEYADSVPYANTIKDVNPQIATGLWSRTGKVIHAPGWWLDKLPLIPLDGELYIGRGKFQETYSTIAKYTPIDIEWEKVDYKIFDSPAYARFWQPREIKVRDYSFTVKHCFMVNTDGPKLGWTYEMVLMWLKKRVTVHEQIQLPFSHFAAIDKINLFLDEIVSKGGEGIMLRNPVSHWETIRSHQLLKYKPHLDAEATVIGYYPGEGKYLGVLGSLMLRAENGAYFKISGFTDNERINAETLFPVGSVVTYKYRELSDDGVPKEPRYFRKAA